MEPTLEPERSALRVQQAATLGQRRLVRAVAPKLAIALVVVLAVDVALGTWLTARIHERLGERVSASLRALVDTHVQTARAWHRAQVTVLNTVLQDTEVQASARALLAVTPPADAEAERTHFRVRLGIIAPFRPRYSLATPDGVVVLSTAGYAVGQPLPFGTLEQLRTSPRQDTQVLPPFFADAGHAEAAALGRISDGQRLAGFVVLHLDADEYGWTLARGSALMESGEVFGFTRDGRLLSGSRFESAYRAAGLLAPTDDSPVLRIALKDPGADLTKGGHPVDALARLPLTVMAQAATKGDSGENLAGYRNALGVPVVGVWRWLDEEGVGVAAELSESEAFAAQRIVTPLLTIVLGVLGALGFGGAMMLVLYREESRRAKALGEKARVLGQYQLGARLGEGGMGVVYEATHALLHRRSAIKLMQPGKFSQTQLARFEREVQVTASLSHPNTIAIYDYGRADDGTFYYVMELLDGSDLHDVVRKAGLMSSARAAFIIRQVCGSVAEAHANGLVHRDIKPSNVFLSQRAGLYDFAKLLDFGLVKAASTHPSGDGPLTAVNALLGTPAFMAPELFDSSENASPRSDIYALGCVIYWMLTGKPLFDAFVTSELRDAHRSGAVKPPSVVSGRLVDPALEAITLRCLAKNPAERPQSAEEVAAALEPLAAQWTASLAREWWQANGAKLGHVVERPQERTLTADDATLPGLDRGAVTKSER